MDDTRKIIKDELPLPKGAKFEFPGFGEMFEEMMVNMGIAMVLALIFIFFVLASLYEHFITPFNIMLVLPLALSGAFFGLLITGKQLDMFSMIGCIMLLGLAAKNSILLVDYANQKVSQGMSREEAIIKAGETRLRPILMTSAALIAGMLPVAIGLNGAARQRASMGVVVIGGLITSTLLSLVVVPAAYATVDRFRSWVSSKFRKPEDLNEVI
jgi:HAE1 family hydrophobic/amphiphilic exporter-1